MSGHGAPAVTADGSGLRVAIVAASWHTEVMDGLVAGAERALAEAGVVDVPLVRVPGTVELTVACARLAPAYDALVALGVVIRGGTPLSGGHGTIIGAVIGMMIIQVISSGLIFFGIDATWSTFVTGAVTVLAVSLDRLVKYQRSRRAERRRETLHS